jgi:hypothetical protein
MPTREEMQGLSQEIIRSYEDRIKGILALRESEAERKSDVATMLKGFDDAHAAMSNELRAELAKRALALRESEAERKQTEAQEIAQRKSEQAGARDEWQKLTATMQAKRGAPVVEVKPPEAVAPPPAEEVADEEAVTSAEVAEATPEETELRDRVFEYLANHPDGTRLVELEREFEVSRFQMGKVVKSLMDENKVEKEDLLYFAR